MGAILRGRLLTLAAFAAVTASFSAPGCSYSTNTTAVQCTSEAECLSKGPEFEGTTCDAVTKTCVRVAADSDLCSTNRECIDRAGGAPSICRKRDRKCVPLTTTECPTVIAQSGQILDDNVIVAGAISPVGAGEVAQFFEDALRMSQAEISRKTKGLPPLPGKSDARPLVYVSCREITAGGTPAMFRALNHLVDELDVPLVLGPQDAANVLIAQSQVLRPKQVMSILPLGYSSATNNLSNPISPTPIAWSVSQTDTSTAKLVAAFVKNVLAPKLEAAGIPKPHRIATLFEGNAFGETSKTVFEKELRWNGDAGAELDVVANSTAGNYLAANIGDLIDFVNNPAPEQKVAQAVTAVQKFKPHIVLHAYGPIAIAKTTIPFMNTWNAATANAPVPYNIEITAGAFNQFPALLDALTRLVPWRAKVFSTTIHRSQERIDRANQWILNFKTEYPLTAPESPIPSFVNVQAWYDAGYLAAYALAAVRDKPLTGPNIAATLPLLQPPGQLIPTGSDQLQTGLGLISNGQGIDLDGLLGNMNLDARTGAPDYDVEMTCTKMTPAGVAGAFQLTNFYSEGGVMKGTFNCVP